MTKPIKCCVDCGKPIGIRCTRCGSCAAKQRMLKRHRRPLYYCIDCHKEICYKCLRCTACNNVHRALVKKVLNVHCIDCGKLLANRYALRCKSCRAKYEWHDFQHVLYSARDKAWKNPKSRMRINAGRFIPSSLEMRFKELLDAAKIAYKQQYRPKGYHRFYDFILPDYNTLVEIDGSFWHHSDWAIQHGNAIVDAEKDKWAIDHGFGMVRIPENDMPDDIVTAWLIPEVLQGVDNAI